MGRRWNGDWLLIARLVFVVGAAAVLVWLSRFPSTALTGAVAFASLALALAVAGSNWLGRREAEPRPVAVLATLLAEAVYGQWRKAADERRLVTPAPISIRWSLSNVDWTGPVATAVGPPDQFPAFPPLAGHTTITEAQLRAGGGRRELHQLFAGLASGRIVVVGAPGAGKSGAAILLLLDILAHRDSLNATKRAQVPVPVLVTGHGWDPNTTSVQDWLRDQLVATYPVFQRRGGDAAALVGARDKIALILDGLDEIDEALRPAALQALSDAPFRIVVLTRGPEMIQAARNAWLVGAVAVELHNATGPEAADYLQRARTGPSPSGWTELLTQLRRHPDGLVARELSTPLTLSLLRDTYHAGDDVGDLLDPTRYSTAEHIERHLIARVLPAAYTPRPGRPPQPYSEAQARQALTFFAQQMNHDHTRDLAWWHIPRWASAMPRIFSTGLKHGLKSGLVYGLVGGFLLGLTVVLVLEVRSEFMIGPGPVVGTIVVTIVITTVVGLMNGPMLGIMGVYAGKLATWRLTRRFKKLIVEPRRIKITASWRAFASRQAVGQGLVGGLTGWFIFWLRDGVVYGLVGGLVYGLAAWLAYGITKNDIGEGRPLSPRAIWRNDRRAGLLIGTILGPALGLVFGLEKGPTGLIAGLVLGLVAGLSFGLFISRATPTILAWRELKTAGYAPAVRLMPFLDDARNRGVLRTVGSLYQFRHATLQDQLAGQTTPDSPVSRLEPPAGGPQPPLDSPAGGVTFVPGEVPAPARRVRRRLHTPRGRVGAALAAVLVVGAAVAVAVTTAPGDQPTTPPVVGPAVLAARRLPIPVNNTAGVALSPDGRRVYAVSNPIAGARGVVSVIDTARSIVTATIGVGFVSSEIAVSPDGRRAYVTNPGTNTIPGNTVSVIDTTSNTVTNTIPVGVRPRGVAVSPDGRRAYVTNIGTDTIPGNTVSVIDTTSNTAVATVPVGQGPAWVAVSPDGRTVYVTDYGSTLGAGNTVSVIDTATNTVTGTITVDYAPDEVAFTPDGRHAYVANGGTVRDPRGSVSVIDTATRTVASTITAAGPLAVAITPDGHRALVANRAPNNSVSVIDTATNTVTGTLTVGPGPFAVTTTPDGHHAYVSSGGLWIIDLP